MTPLSEHILKNYQIRKSKKDKLRFIDLLRSHFPQLQVEEGGFGGSRNIVIGDVKTARVLLTAHYDTCAQLPFPNFITPKNLLFYLLYQIAIALPFIALMIGVMAGLRALGMPVPISLWVSYAVLLGSMVYVFMLGKPNPHTANDNTSGVITLLELMDRLTDEEKSQVAFVFFDNEENGLWGSARFAKVHKADGLKDKLVLNFDCVSDGDHMLFVLNKPCYQRYGDAFRAAFPEEMGKSVSIDPSSKAFYPSDQGNFPVNAAVAALKKHKWLGLYMDRIHTPRDTVFQEESISYLVNGTQRLLHKIGEVE